MLCESKFRTVCLSWCVAMRKYIFFLNQIHRLQQKWFTIDIYETEKNKVVFSFLSWLLFFSWQSGFCQQFKGIAFKSGKKNGTHLKISKPPSKSAKTHGIRTNMEPPSYRQDDDLSGREQGQVSEAMDFIDPFMQLSLSKQLLKEDIHQTLLDYQTE